MKEGLDLLASVNILADIKFALQKNDMNKGDFHFLVLSMLKYLDAENMIEVELIENKSVASENAAKNT